MPKEELVGKGQACGQRVAQPAVKAHQVRDSDTEGESPGKEHVPGEERRLGQLMGKLQRQPGVLDSHQDRSKVRELPANKGAELVVVKADLAAQVLLVARDRFDTPLITK